ncbi:alginate lyase family protein [Haloferula sp.]|uniref:alginate lyase family protein n=1 Tax=Haloferula sp. TaxID=2497595 RepID=UPI00329B8638
MMRIGWLGVWVMSLVGTAIADFVHPGIAHSKESLVLVKGKIEAGKEPWKSSWEALKESRYANLDWEPRTRARVERGPSNRLREGSDEYLRDADAAYTHALIWALSGEEAHARKAAEILDAWSGTLKSIENHDAKLLVGMAGYPFCNAAELLKHTWDGWPEDRQERFGTMLRKIWNPIIRDFYPTANGNWDASMIQTLMAMGVFLDDQVMFDWGKNYYLHGSGNGAIGNYFKKSGQCQESGRDQLHTHMGLEFLSNACETAWTQGIDLYGAQDNLLLKGFEYTAKYNLGNEVPYEPYRSVDGRYLYRGISDKGRGRLSPIYEKVFNHYHHRKGLEAPFVKKVLEKGRSGRRDRGSSARETLMFSGEED